MGNFEAMTRILALDLATVTGHATYGAGVITSGSQDFSRYPGSRSRPADHTGAPFLRFHRWLSLKIAEDKPEAIAYEETGGFYKGPHTPRIMYGLRAVMLAVAAQHGLPCHGYPNMTVKKSWTGKGTADKDAMMAEASRRFPDLELTDSNEADALAVLHLHLSGKVSIN